MLLISQTIGKQIAHYRKELQLTQKELAAMVGMDANHLYCIEAGRKHPQISILARLAAGLGVPIDELSGRS